MNFQEWNEGEWHEPVHDNYKMACCDCGLVHTVDFSVRGRFRPQVQMRWFRDDDGTNAERKARNISVDETTLGGTVDAVIAEIGDNEADARLVIHELQRWADSKFKSVTA